VVKQGFLILLLFWAVSSDAFVSSCATYDIENTHPEKVRVGIVSKCMVKGDTLYLDGAIDPYIIDELSVYPTTPIRKVSLNSDGGLVKDAFEIAEFIRANNIETFVRKDAVCKSACTLLFQAGVKRVAHQSSIFMYHGARFIPQSSKQISKLERCAKEQTEECHDFNEQKYLALKETTDQLFQRYRDYDIADNFYELYLSLPEDPLWYEDGNFIKTMDWEMTALESMNYNIVQYLAP
jgi:hypothetical protein